MKGYRFYLEHETPAHKRKKQHSGNVCAVAFENGYRFTRDGAIVEGASGIYEYPNSPVCWTGMSDRYLRENCKRISEQAARKIHPQLFEYLDGEDCED